MGGGLQLLHLLGARRWTLADVDTLPYGVAAPLHEALQLLRDCTPPGACARLFDFYACCSAVHLQ